MSEALFVCAAIIAAPSMAILLGGALLLIVSGIVLGVGGLLYALMLPWVWVLHFCRLRSGARALTSVIRSVEHVFDILPANLPKS